MGSSPTPGTYEHSQASLVADVGVLIAKERLKRKLAKTTNRAQRARAELAVLEEQLVQVREEAADARTRSIVSEAPMDRHDEREATRQLEALERGANDLRQEIARLEVLQDELLDQLVALS